MDRIKTTVIKAEDNPDYPPFAFVYEDIIVGYDIDIAAEFCEAYGLSFRSKMTNRESTDKERF